MRPKHLLVLFAFIGFSAIGFGQNKPKIKFKKLEATDFDLSAYQFDSGAEAVVIMDAGIDAVGSGCCHSNGREKGKKGECKEAIVSKDLFHNGGF
jgi:hypothetical protein